MVICAMIMSWYVTLLNRTGMIIMVNYQDNLIAIYLTGLEAIEKQETSLTEKFGVLMG